MASSGSSWARRSDAPNSSASTSDRFRLTGPTIRLDPRIHAARRDIADVALADRVFAPHYAKPLVHSCVCPHIPVRGAASAEAPAVSELLMGERFAVVDVGGAWAWGYACADSYVGYVPVDALGSVLATDHVVASAAALVFAIADIKSPVVLRLPMGARIAGAAEGDFVRTAEGFVHRRHLATGPERDPVTIAERLIGTPYRWGGRSGDGIDCSGLVQLALSLCGVSAPRDSDQQRVLGDDVTRELERGDLVFFPGHVGWMADGKTLVHANAYWMAVTREPLADVVARQPEGAGILAKRRLTW